MPFENVVAETSDTVGTGAYTFTGAVFNSRTLAAALTDGLEYGYRCAYADGTTPGFEVGTGIWTASGGTLARTNIENSSNAGAAVSWVASELVVEITLTAAQLAIFAQKTRVDSSDAGVYGTLVGLINGSNMLYTTTQAYAAGTLVVNWNGQIQSTFTETDPVAGQFTLPFAPGSGYIMAQYETP